MKIYTEEFFKKYYNKKAGNSIDIFVKYLQEAINEFLVEESKDNAFMVYENFFDCYKLKIKDKKNFVDLLDVLKDFEENAAILTDKQRDHYIHSVNVFLIGLSVYAMNSKFEESYSQHQKTEGLMANSSIEEFLFEWGISALCHDIGYPFEITTKQITKFTDMITKDKKLSSKKNKTEEEKEKDIAMEARPYIDFHKFENLNSLNSEFANYVSEKNHGVRDPIGLLALRISEIFEVDESLILQELTDFPEKMKKIGFVDHGFYSSLIVLKWFSELFDAIKMNHEGWMNSIISPATAILLHNYYKNALLKDPFNLEILTCDKHPLSFLLILCDELQDWNRMAYGIEDKKKASAKQSVLELKNENLTMTYLTHDDEMSADYSDYKEKAINEIIDIKSILQNGLTIKVKTRTDFYIDDIKKQDKIYPRVLLDNIELLAKKTHENYNKKQIERNPDKELEYPSWEDLPQTLKFSNVRNAKSMINKLRKIYMYVSPENADDDVLELSEGEVEYLARVEHNSWMNERMTNGWTYGPKKNVNKKVSPYMIPYKELTEDIKELDRDTVRNMIGLLNSIGLKVYRMD